MPRGVQVFAFIMTLALVLGHLTSEDEKTFPFVTWWMYGHVMYGHPPKHDLVGHTAHGKEVELVATRLFPSLSGKRLTSRLQKQIGRLFIRERPEIRRQHELLVGALVDVYNARHEDPIVSVTVKRQEFLLKPYYDYAPEVRDLWTLEFPE